MTTKRWSNAFIFIAASALSTWATAENVYKCGNTYSQSPCPGAQVLSVDDTRDPQQKKLKDEITQRDAALAREMEQDRLKQEQALRTSKTQHPVVHKKATKAVVAHEEAPLSKPKRLKHPSEKTKDFVAVAPKAKQPGDKKKRSKKAAQDAQP